MLDSATELHLHKLLATLSEYKGSDLHLTVANPPSIRIGGKLQALSNELLLTSDFIQTVIRALLTDTQLQQLELKKDFVTAITIKSKARYKIHAYAQQGNYSLSFRLIPTTVPPLSRWTIHAAVKRCIEIERGLIVVAGSYGSGKSALITSLIEEYNQAATHHIMTFEQPIEFVYTDAQSIIEQVELGTDIPDLPAARERVYQEDIDIIMVSCPLDSAVMRTVLQFVDMGKLVIVEVLAPTTQLVLDSIVGVFHANEQLAIRESLANGLQAVITIQPIAEAGQTTVLACEVLRQTTATINFIKHDSFAKIALLLENGRNDGMVTFEQSIR